MRQSFAGSRDLQGLESALHPYAGHSRNGHRIEARGHPIMLGVPLGAGPAHVVKLGAVGIEQRFREALEEVEDIGSQAWRLPAIG